MTKRGIASGTSLRRWEASSRRDSSETRFARRPRSAGSTQGDTSKSCPHTNSAWVGVQVKYSWGASSPPATPTGLASRTTRNASHACSVTAACLVASPSDFVAVRRGTRWRCDAIEVNLRKGGTTHPFLMLDFLTNGAYDRRTGTHRTRSGQALSYIATDNLQQQRYVGLNPDDLVAIAVEQGLHYHAASHEGVVFHLIGALERYGKIGMLCIAADLKRAEHLCARTVEVLDREGGRRARRARLGRTPPRSG